MELKKLDMPLSVIQVDNLSDIDLSVTPLFLGKTEDELSVVLPTKNVPSITVSREDDWQGFRHVGYMSVPTELAQKIESKELTIKEVATILNEESFL